MNKRGYYSIGCFFLTLILVVVNYSAARGSTFRCETIDANNNGRIAIGDVDGDGQHDVVVHTWGTNRGHVPDGTLVWYRYPSWEKHTISSGEKYYGDEIQVADLDGDGDLDVIAPLGQHYQGTTYAEVCWYENDPTGGAWVKHKVLDRIDGSEVKDLHVHDLDNDGRPDVAIRLKEDAVICYQTDNLGWKTVRIKIQAREGSIVGDIDSDGFDDLVCNGYWLKNPGNRTGQWERYDIDPLWYKETSFPAKKWLPWRKKKAAEPWRRFAVRAAVGDLDQNGKIEWPSFQE